MLFMVEMTVNPPHEINKEEFAKLVATEKHVRKNCKHQGNGVIFGVLPVNMRM